MNSPVDTRVDSAPSVCYLGVRLKIGFSFLRRFLSNAIAILSASISGLVLAYEIPVLLGWLICDELLSPLWLIWLLVFGVGGSVAWGLIPGWGLTPVESLRRQVILATIVFLTTSAVIFTSNSVEMHVL